MFSLDDPELPPAKLRRVIRARGVPAGLVAPLGRERGSLPEVLFQDIAGATIGTYMQSPNLHRAAAYQYWAAWEALENLHRLGYRNSAFVIDEGTHYGGRCQFAAGFHWWHIEHGSTPGEALILPSLSEEHRQRFLEWVRAIRPEVIVSGSEGSLLLEWLREDGWEVPEAMGFIALTVFEESTLMAGMRVHSERIGAAAIDLLLGQLNRNECGIPETPKLVLIKNQWSDGPTVRDKATS
jgi:LacI family transcriptional regulator/LacI family fructose operon transcriptional repressor